MGGAVLCPYIPAMGGSAITGYPAARGAWKFESLVSLSRQLLPTDPVGSATLTFTSLQPGTDIVVLRAGTDEALLDLNETAGSSHAFTYSLFSTPTVVDIAFYKAGFVPHTSIRNFTLPSTNAVLPITQVVDRNYRNPT